MTVSRLIIRHKKAIGIFWFLLSVILLLQAPGLRHKIDTSSRWESGESAEASKVVSQNFSSLGKRQAVVVVSGVEIENETTNQLLLLEIFNEFRDLEFVVGVDSPLTLKGTSLFASGETAIGIVSFNESVPLEKAIRSMRGTADAVSNELLADVPGSSVHITGSSAIDYDTIVLSNQHIRMSELIALPLILFLLIWVFGTLTAALLPILLACASIGLTLGGLSIMASHFSISIVAQSMTTLLGLALGTDYALLMVTRFREQLKLTENPRSAMEQSIKEAGTTVFLSGSAIIIGFSAMLVIPAAELRSVAIAGVIVTSVAVLLATTLLPLVLWALGGRINSGRIRKSLIGRDDTAVWKSWSRQVTARPYLYATVSILFLVLLALPAKDLRMSFPDEGWMSSNVDSVRGIEALKRDDKSGIIHRLTVVYQHPDGQSPLDEFSWEALKSFRLLLEKDERIDSVISLPSLVPATTRANELKFMLTDEVIRRFSSPDGDLSLFEVIPRSGLAVGDLIGLVVSLRDLDLTSLQSAPKSIRVTGLPAATYDYLQLIKRWAPTMVTIIVLGTLVALFIGFRSFLVPIKAVALNLLTVAASLGVFQWIFMAGHGHWMFGLDSPLGGVFPAIPILVFCTVFGISMDYEIFLIRRVEQSRKTARTESESVMNGLTSSSRVITSAALIMIAVFGAFAIGDFLPVTMLGVALAVAIILDATIVRLIVSPALLCIAGRWNWWPGRPPKEAKNRAGS